MNGSHEVMNEQRFSQKSYAVAVILSAIFGILGIHHFYLGRWGHGLFDLALSVTGFVLIGSGTLVLLGMALLLIDVIHTLVVTIRLIIGEYRDGKGLKVPYPGQEKKQLEKVFE